MDVSAGILMAVIGAVVVIALFAILIPRWSKANKAKPGALKPDKFFEIRRKNRP
ncbi:hypothetical protein GU243_18040 [Pseudarthrobacter psychrotolerans]|uniref:Uncharacterized protein n=1 Tax=Pseudarthrobacter psychrotolerans TaxID=2697569 RepID=A0A6P1NRR5_9MICC|nr:hypothetical protein [Pseudarthrobacter psychrotolerans]QHK21294.1 hypothetical protein GU243_18040 [Pseudarthrobacter psychrotolerans]